MTKKRAKPPLNYCEESKRKRSKKKLTDEEEIIEVVKDCIKVKSERITYLKKALSILNRDDNKRGFAGIDDLEEYDQLLADHMPQRDDINIPNPLHNQEVDDDCIVVHAGTRMSRSNVMTIGIDTQVLEVDRDLSAEYSYTTDVR